MEALIGHLPRTHTQLYSDSQVLANNLSQNYDKNTAYAKLITDCDSVGMKIAIANSATLHTPYTEDSTQNAEGLLITAYPGRTTWNSQYFFPNGTNSAPFYRGINKDGWSKWERLAAKSDLTAYSTKAQLESTFINLSNKRYVKITANEANANYGIIFVVTNQGILCAYNSDGRFTTLFESTGNKVKISSSGLITTVDCTASYTHGFVLRGGSLKNMPFETS